MNNEKVIKTILLVEDEAIISIIVAKALKRFGYDVITVNSGEKAVELAAKGEAINLILMDINLGSGIDGTEAARSILALRNIPIVFHTSHSEREMVEKVRDITRYGYVVKSSGDFVLQSTVEMAFALFDAHESVRKESKRSEAILKAIPDMMFVVDSNGYFRDFSSNSEEDALAIHPDKIIGSNVSDMFSHEETVKHIALFQKCLKTGEAQNYSYSLDMAGQHKIFELRLAKLDNDHVLSIVRDITMSRKTEEALIESEFQFRQLVEASPYAIVVHKNGIISYINQTCVKLMRYQNAEEAVGEILLDRVHPDSRPLVIERMKVQAIDGRMLPPVEEKLLRRDGEICSAEVTTIISSFMGEKAVLAFFSDITERKHAEAEIRSKNEELEALNEELNAAIEEMEAANEELLASNEDLLLRDKALLREKAFIEAILEGIPGYLYVYDEGGNLIRWNKKHEEMTGYSAEELSHMNMSDWFEGEDAVRVAAVVEEVFKTGYGEVEANLLIKGGSKLLILSNGIRLNMDGKTYFTGVGIDVTQRRRDEDALRASEEKYRILTESIKDVVWILDAQTLYFTYVSPSVEKLRGYTPEEIMALPVNAALTPEASAALINLTHARADDLLAGKLSPDQFYINEIEQPCKDGSTVWTEVVTSYYFNEKTGHVNVRGVTRDISDRKKIEDELRDSERFLSGVIENNGALIFIKGRDGHYEFVNRRWEETLGFSRGYTIGKTDREIFPERAAEEFRRIDEYVMEHGILETEETLEDDSGKRYFLTVKIPVIDKSNSVKGVCGMSTEITARKLAEERIKSLLAEKELILREVHHRIKNNMNTIRNLFALQSLEAEDPEVAAALIDAGNRVVSMLVLYDKLYCSAEFNKLSVKEYFDTLIDEIISGFPKNDVVKIIKQIEDITLDVKVLSPLGIILNELLTNIMKYAFTVEKNGIVSVILMTNNNHVIIIVGDNGITMPESVNFENTPGFGLSLVSMLTQQIGGSIRIDRGDGTRFILEFDV